jgi:hypothetical protein
MTYPEYRKDLQNIHESEVYGRAVFDTAAKLSLSQARKDKWLALRALEEQTLNRYLEYMGTSGQTITEPFGQALKGRVEGAALALMPWRLAMTLVRRATGPFQQRFLRLKDHADGEDKKFFAYVYAHEKAIEAFADKELKKDPNSLTAVHALLDG